MELLIYATGGFAKAVKDNDRSETAPARFLDLLGNLNAKVKRASEKFGTIVVEAPDEKAGVLADFSLKDDILSSSISNVEKLQYQVRINLAEAFALAAQNDPGAESLKPLSEVLNRYNAVIKNQFEAFADFCRQAEAEGATDTVLYKWTKATIEKPGKKEQYASRCTIYADGGKEVYDREIADALEADLQPLLASGLITRINKFDTDPAANPQAPGMR